MLGDFINFESFLNPDKKNWDFDPESIFYNGSEPTVTVSPKAVAFDIETTFDNSLYFKICEKCSLVNWVSILSLTFHFVKKSILLAF